MNVYVESNFVLELALLQEQYESCQALLRLCETSSVRLVIPGYSVAEPHETLLRRQKQRKRLKKELDDEIRQIARTTTYADGLSRFDYLTSLLIRVTDEEAKRLDDIRAHLVKVGSVIPLDASVLAAATQYEKTHGFSPQDAIVYSSVLSHLRRSDLHGSCFLNRNSRDFDDQNIVDELGRYNCKLLYRFDSGRDYILRAIS